METQCERNGAPRIDVEQVWVDVNIEDDKHQWDWMLLSTVIRETMRDHPDVKTTDTEAQKRPEYRPGMEYYVPTTRFLKDLAGRLTEIFEVACTATVAHTVFMRYFDIDEELKKNTGMPPS